MAGKPQVLIAGAGFGGLWAARELDKQPVEVLVLDRNNYHTFQPLLYQVAAAEVEPEAIAYPVRSTLSRSRNVHFLMGEMTGINLKDKVVECRGREIFYDYLILALGSATNFLGVEGAAEHAFQLKTLEQAIALRNQILTCFERSALEPDPERRKRALSFTIVGGGPTGVEFAGALQELIGGMLVNDYPLIDPREIRVVLLEAFDCLLAGLPRKLQDYALRRLEKMGVEVFLGTAVSRVTPRAVFCGDGARIATETVVWTAGVRGESLRKGWGLPLSPGGRLPVEPTLQVLGHPEIYVIGDLAYLEEGRRPLAMMAPVATQQGTAAAQNILRKIHGAPENPFRYHNLGNMVTIGRNKAVASLLGRSFTGWTAWLIWLGVHLFNLIGFRNRLLVLINWSWDYFCFDRTVKLILPRDSKERPASGRFVHCRKVSAGNAAWPLNVLRIDRRKKRGAV